jgi:hypothetical protein
MIKFYYLTMSYDLSDSNCYFYRFTQKNILRVYPRATRVKSTNFKPHLGWMYGAQMVAFNMQVRKLSPKLH